VQPSGKEDIPVKTV
jgi:hypothetical protein